MYFDDLVQRAAAWKRRRTVMRGKMKRLILRAARVAFIGFGLLALTLFASWIQACVLALTFPKGLIEIEWGFHPDSGWHKDLGWAPERSHHETYMAIVTEIENELARADFILHGIEREEYPKVVPDYGEDVCSRWFQENILSLFDKRFRKKTPEERQLIPHRGMDMPMVAEWYGFPFNGWEVRFDEYNISYIITRHPIPILFGIDTKISRLPLPWWRPPYRMGTNAIPNRILPVVPRVPQALANGALTMAAGWGVWRLFKRIRADRRELRGLCGICAYPRTPATPGGPGEAGGVVQTCPECGSKARVVRRLVAKRRWLNIAWVQRA